MKLLLTVMNPRRIPSCLSAIQALNVDKVWLSFFTERELEPIVSHVIDEAREKGYTHLLMLSDDTEPTQKALDKVVEGLASFPKVCVTAYCNLDETSDPCMVNLTSSPFTRDESVGIDYAFVRREEVERWPHAYYRSFFAGMCLTGMTLDMWKRFPFRVLNNEWGTGYASDWLLSRRLQAAEITILAPVGAFVQHRKKLWTEPDLSSPERRLLVGREHRAVTWGPRPAPGAQDLASRYRAALETISRCDAGKGYMPELARQALEED